MSRRSNCSFPPPLTDDEISAALYDDASPSIHEHLSRCPACAARLEEARQFDRNLMMRLSRLNCPTSDELGDYLMGLLDENAQQSVAHHLETCSRCRNEIQTLRRFMNMPDTQSAPATVPSIGRSLRGAIAQILPPQTALATRGQSTRQVVASVENTTIFLEIEAVDDGFVLTGQMITDNDTSWSGALLEIRQAGALKATAILDEMNEFHCDALPSGVYELRITGQPGYQVVLESLPIT